MSRKKNVVVEDVNVVEEVNSLVEETIKDDEVVNDVVVEEVSSLVDETIKDCESFKKNDDLFEYNFEMKLLYMNKKQLVVKSKSDMFRLMYDNGMEVCEISKVSKSHYSFVYEVISKSNGQVRNVVRESKSDEFRKLFDEGKTVGQIAKLTNSNYSFVHTCIKKYKESKEVVNK